MNDLAAPAISVAAQTAIDRLFQWRADPVAFVTDALRVTPEPWQIEALHAIGQTDKLAIRGGRGVGKDALLAWIMLWWFVTRYPCKILCTAPKASQLEDNLWGEVRLWKQNLAAELAPDLDIKSDRIDLLSSNGLSFAVARVARKENPEAFQGLHSLNMMLIFDESSGIDDILFHTAMGSLSTEGSKMILAGNPTRTQGFFYNAFHRSAHLWKTMKVPCSASRYVSKSFLDDAEAEWGKDHPLYFVHVLAEFPPEDERAVIPLHLVEDAIGREVEPLPGVEEVWGVDVARFGDDRSALAKRMGNVLSEPIRFWSGKDIMQTSGIIAAEYDAAKKKPAMILVDSIGLGAGVADRLREVGLPVRGVNVSESPSVEDKFMRQRDELWWKAREWFAARDCKMPDDRPLLAELTMPTYEFTSAGKLKVESKSDVKKRTGRRSPDLADAFCLTFAAGTVRKSEFKKKIVYNSKWIV